jgi:acetylornithine deacetylase/succinyl-diaminopimelate desuccinylase-like protein
MSDLEELRRRVAERVQDDATELIDLAVELGRMPSPHAQELPVAQRVVEWLRENGIESWLQPITESSANAVGRVRGEGDGPRVIFDAHIDTGPVLSPSAPERIRRINDAWEENGILYGFGLVNCKAQVAAFMLAARALVREQVRLAGDLIVAGVTFETGAPSVGSTQGIDYPGEGFGTWWLVNRGVTADYALIGETSGFGLVTAECGELGLEIRARGRHVYTPRFARGPELAEHPSAVVRLAAAVTALEEWALDYEQRAAVDSPAGRIVPRAQVYRLEGNPSQSSLRLDIRLPPGANPRPVEREVRHHLEAAGLTGLEVEAYQWSRGYVAQGAEALIEAVRGAHGEVIGGTPPPPPTPEISMWRDLNIFNEVGIPSICYGAPRASEPYSDSGDRAMRAEDLVKATQVYALTAVNLCGVA